MNLRWTLVEVVAAVLFVWTLGPAGLAWSYALVVWVGLWLLIGALSRNTGMLASDLARQIVIRPSVICATLTTAIVVSIAKAFHFPAVGSSLIYALAAFVILSSYLFEPELRGFLVHGET
jgi:peptidoglycan biosynthesis protein MviN/MurJ (putative lipid II flippase)